MELEDKFHLDRRREARKAFQEGKRGHRKAGGGDKCGLCGCLEELWEMGSDRLIQSKIRKA